jgi:hypothetical protein
MEHRDVEGLPQPGLDLEAPRCGDVLEVDAAVDRGERDHRADDLVHVLGVQADRPGVHAGELLEQRGLALHDRQRRSRADVAQAEDGRAVGHDRDGVALDGQPARVLGVLGDGEADSRDPGRVRPGQVVAMLQRHLGHDLDLPAQVDEERPVADLPHPDAGEGGDPRGDVVGVFGIGGVAGHVDHDAVRTTLDDVERGQRATCRAHRRGELACSVEGRRRVHPHGDGVSGTGGGHGGSSCGGLVCQAT